MFTYLYQPLRISLSGQCEVRVLLSIVIASNALFLAMSVALLHVCAPSQIVFLNGLEGCLEYQE
jgi:hypothetical protein